MYVDAFAGGGRSIVRGSEAADATALLDLGQEFHRDHEAREVIDGSPRVALEVEPPFTRYVFLERDAARVQMLRTLEREYGARRKIVIRQGDCNDYLKSLVGNARISWKEWRGVVFLDPFGMHVPWSTIARIAESHALEVFLNFPVGMAIQRLLKRSGQFAERERAKLDDYFGDPEWFNVVYPLRTGLFGAERSKAENAAHNLVQWYQRRLRNAFGYASMPYLVRNTSSGHLYYLMFAGPNKTGKKIADYVLKGGEKV